MKVEAIIKETFRLNPETEILGVHRPGQLEGWDSLGHVSLMAALEAAYHISLGVDEIMRITCVDDIKAILKEKGVREF